MWRATYIAFEGRKRLAGRVRVTMPDGSCLLTPCPLIIRDNAASYHAMHPSKQPSNSCRLAKKWRFYVRPSQPGNAPTRGSGPLHGTRNRGHANQRTRSLDGTRISRSLRCGCTTSDAAASCALGRSVPYMGLGVCVGVRRKWRGGPDLPAVNHNLEDRQGSWFTACQPQRYWCLGRWLLVFRCAGVGSPEGGSGDG